jgi:hypothetical protein
MLDVRCPIGGRWEAEDERREDGRMKMEERRPTAEGGPWHFRLQIVDCRLTNRQTNHGARFIIVNSGGWRVTGAGGRSADAGQRFGAAGQFDLNLVHADTVAPQHLCSRLLHYWASSRRHAHGNSETSCFTIVAADDRRPPRPEILLPASLAAPRMQA